MGTFGNLSKEPEHCLDIELESVFLAQNGEACWSRQSMEPGITQLLLTAPWVSSYITLDHFTFFLQELLQFVFTPPKPEPVSLFLSFSSHTEAK